MKSSVFYTLIFLIFIFSTIKLKAQVYDDFYGAGHTTGVNSSSSDTTQVNDNPETTLSGTGYMPNDAEASRFLSQATMGHNYDDIEYVKAIGIEAWIDEQLGLTPDSTFLQYYDNYFPIAQVVNSSQSTSSETISFPFHHYILKKDDKLRQKMAFALSQILVVSINNSTLKGRPRGISDYYDILHTNCYGNYRDILQQVTKHPIMAHYLSYWQNSKIDYGLNTRPDENYAREVMQLFSIGLVELNLDGTQKLDGDGNIIPTYTYNDIEELSKVFTGLSAGARKIPTDDPHFFLGTGGTDLTHDLAMYSYYHDITEKRMLDGTILPAGRTGFEDIEDAIDFLFNHPNVGPFISYRLIQQFVKSNPSPAYIARVATVFNNNGKGVRGDLGAVLKAILMDDEARDCDAWLNDNESGKLIQPVERWTKIAKAFDYTTDSGIFWIYGRTSASLKQRLLGSPTVFNFFTPFYAEEKVVSINGLVSPEFQIVDENTAIQYINEVENKLNSGKFFNDFYRVDDGTGNYVEQGQYLDFSDELTILQNDGVAALLDHLGILLCRGQLSSQTKATIENALNQYRATINGYTDEETVEDAIMFMVVSPDFMILK